MKRAAIATVMLGCSTPARLSPPTPPADPLFEAASGPFESLAAYCAKSGRPACTWPSAGSDHELAGEPVLAEAASPWLAAQIGLVGDDSLQDCALGVHVAAGWYVVPEAAPCLERTFMSSRVSIEPAASAVVARIVVVHYEKTHDGDVPSGHVWTSTCEQRIVACGLGRDNAPSCTRSLGISGGECDGGGPGAPPDEAPTWIWELAATIRNDALVLEAGAGAKLPDDAAKLVGTHRWR